VADSVAGHPRDFVLSHRMSILSASGASRKGSARASRAQLGALAEPLGDKVHLGEAPRPTREARVLPRLRACRRSRTKPRGHEIFSAASHNQFLSGRTKGRKGE